MPARRDRGTASVSCGSHITSGAMAQRKRTQAHRIIVSSHHPIISTTTARGTRGAWVSAWSPAVCKMGRQAGARRLVVPLRWRPCQARTDSPPAGSSRGANPSSINRSTRLRSKPIHQSFHLLRSIS
eukprot:2824715-Prymnesium_polylepis.1